MPVITERSTGILPVENPKEHGRPAREHLPVITTAPNSPRPQLPLTPHHKYRLLLPRFFLTPYGHVLA